MLPHRAINNVIQKPPAIDTQLKKALDQLLIEFVGRLKTV